MRYAIIDKATGIVVNVVEYETEPSLEELAVFGDDFVAVESGIASPGWIWRDGVLADPIPTPTLSVQAQLRMQIAALEAQQTPRRTREAILGLDNGWLKNNNDQIAALRAQLIP